MKFTYLLFCACCIGISGCSLSDGNAPIAIEDGIVVPGLVVSGSQNLWNTGVTMDQKSSLHAEMVTNEAIPLPRKASSIDELDAIESLDDVLVFSPWVAYDSAHEHRQFIDLQKKKLILWFLEKKIDDIQYLELQKKQWDIFLWKDKWPLSLKLKDADYQKLIDTAWDSTLSWSIQWERERTLIERQELLQKFQSSNEYIQWIISKQSELQKLDKELKSYWTADMRQLQDDIQVLNKQVYQIQ